MNVSQQEYETKYREYLERVNRRSSGQLELPRSQRRPRRQALRQQDDETDGEFEEEEIEEDQEDIVEDEDDSSQRVVETRHLYSFPNSGKEWGKVQKEVPIICGLWRMFMTFN